MTIYDPIPFDYPYRIDCIYLVGAGGTGSFLARSIAMILYHMRELGLAIPGFYIQDHDLVEPSNLGRQLFTPADLHLPKSQVLAMRLNFAFGLEIHAMVEPYTHKSHYPGAHSLICGTVDNHLARRELAEAHCPVIDCGNHYNTGQVILGTRRRKEDIASLLDRRRDRHRDPDQTLSELPNFAAVFPDMLEPEAEGDGDGALSCAQLVAANQQHVLINSQLAAIAACYVHSFLMRQPIETFISFVDLETRTVRSISTSEANIRTQLGLPLPDEKPPKHKRKRRKSA